MLTTEKEILNFRKRVYNAKKVKDITNLPKEFLDTGEVWLLPDGGLSATPPAE